MSGATYRIDVRHEPGDAWKYKAEVRRLSDGAVMAVKVADTAEDVVYAARQYVVDLNTQREPFTLHVDDDGQDADAPHSVKA